MAILKNMGIIHLYLFGSYSKNQETSESDIDLMYEFDPMIAKDPLGISSAYSYLSDLLHHPIDLVSKKTLHPLVRKQILDSCIQLF